MEHQPENTDFRNNLKIFHPWFYQTDNSQLGNVKYNIGGV